MRARHKAALAGDVDRLTDGRRVHAAQVGLPYWNESEDKKGARLRLAGVFGMTLATDGKLTDYMHGSWDKATLTRSNARIACCFKSDTRSTLMRH